MTDTRKQLAAIPDLYALLPLFLLPGTGTDDDGRAKASPKRPPGSLAVLDLLDTREKPDADPTRQDFDLDRRAGARRQGVLPTLASWSRLVDSELWDEGREHTPPSDDPTVAGECGFLLEHLRWAEDHQWFDELAADIAGIHRDLMRAVREPDPIALRCPICTHEVETMANGGWFRCLGCDHRWSRMEAHRLYERQKPMTLAECAESIGRPVKTLHHWKAQGLLKPVGRDAGGALYRLADVQAAALGLNNRKKEA